MAVDAIKEYCNEFLTCGLPFGLSLIITAYLTVTCNPEVSHPTSNRKTIQRTWHNTFDTTRRMMVLACCPRTALKSSAFRMGVVGNPYQFPFPCTALEGIPARPKLCRTFCRMPAGCPPLRTLGEIAALHTWKLY